MNEKHWHQLAEEHEVNLLRADICIGSPESYNLDEKRRICESIDASTAEIDAAMRADFNSLPGFAKAAFLDMLGAPGTPEREWWEGILLPFDELPDAPPATA